jgi:GH24 family phage-related lysozyme (muramidase)
MNLKTFSSVLEDQDFVRELQNRLNQHGYQVGVVDGIFGPKTTTALNKFAKDKNLPSALSPELARLLLNPQPEKRSLTINAAGLELIKTAEGLKLEAYLCPNGIWTIGYGHTNEVSAGDRISEAEAESLLKQDITEFESVVSDVVKVPVNSNQFSALVAFVFNVGGNAFQKSTLLRLLNQSDYSGAADQFLRWDKADGRSLPGLTARRQAERALFLS